VILNHLRSCRSTLSKVICRPQTARLRFRHDRSPIDDPEHHEPHCLLNMQIPLNRVYDYGQDTLTQTHSPKASNPTAPKKKRKSAYSYPRIPQSKDPINYSGPIKPPFPHPCTPAVPRRSPHSGFKLGPGSAGA
jgi:hypothetical protein